MTGEAGAHLCAIIEWVEAVLLARSGVSSSKNPAAGGRCRAAEKTSKSSSPVHLSSGTRGETNISDRGWVSRPRAGSLGPGGARPLLGVAVARRAAQFEDLRAGETVGSEVAGNECARSPHQGRSRAYAMRFARRHEPDWRCGETDSARVGEERRSCRRTDREPTRPLRLCHAFLRSHTEPYAGLVPCTTHLKHTHKPEM